MADTQFQKGKKILITGGAGFVGSHLSERLLDASCLVQVVDDLRSGSTVNLPFSNPNLSFEELCVGSPICANRLEELVASVDFVFHLASPIGVLRAHKESYDLALSILLGGIQIAEICRKYKIPVLFTSSSEVYGLPDKTPTPEDSMLSLKFAPRFSYASAKMTIEHLFFGLCREADVNTWIVRLFNIAGPRQRPEAGVVAGFAKDIVKGTHSLNIHGDGTQKRSFLHVKDAVEALISVVDSSQLRGKIVNIGADENISVRELANRIMTAHGCSGKITFSSYSKCFGEEFVPVMNRLPDTSLLRELTCWRPKLSIDDIVRDCLDHAKDRY